MNWSTRRKFLYAMAVFIFLLATSLYLFWDVIFKKPTCFDGKQNAFEVGVDCGGGCSLKCTQEVSPLTVKWSRFIKTASSTYDLVAMITNKNVDNASHLMAHRITLYGKDGEVLGIYNGSTTPPIDGDFPIIIQNVQAYGEVASITTELTDQPHYAVASKPTSPTLKVLDARYEAGDISRVFAKISNSKQVTLENISIKVILYDSQDNAFAIGETVVPFFNKEESKNVSFTWPYPLKETPTKIRIYPLLNPFMKAE